jgi:hypothetical protein
MLQMRFGQPEIARPAQATAANALGVRALDPGPPGILSLKLGGLLPLPGGLDRLVLGFRPDRELAGGVFGPGAYLARRTGATGRPIEADTHDGIAGDIPSRGPFHTRLPLWTTRLLRFPLN